MSASTARRGAAGVVIALLLFPGCALLDTRTQHRTLTREYQHARDAAAAPADDLPFAAAATLDRSALVGEVLRRNPTIAAARSAWRAALARYPQVTALEDPMVGAMIGPRSFGSREVGDAVRFDASQAFPFPGKLALRGAIALAEAEAMARDHDGVRVRLAAMASSLYDEAWLQARSLEITRRHLEAVRALREAALGAYESGLATQQDPLRVELDEADLMHVEVEFETALRVARAQLAALLHIGDAASIPTLPETLPALGAPVDSEAVLAEQALKERPEMRAADARVEARQAGEALAQREFFPDFKIVGGWDSFWENPDQRPFVGLEWNLPLQIGRRNAALEEARAESARAREERQSTSDSVRAEVATAALRLRESEHLIAITRDRRIPAARDQLDAARANYESGVAPFRDLIDAQRMLWSAELEEQSAVAEQSRRAAELLAALGIVPGAPPETNAALAPNVQNPGEHHE